MSETRKYRQSVGNHPPPARDTWCGEADRSGVDRKARGSECLSPLDGACAPECGVSSPRSGWSPPWPVAAAGPPGTRQPASPRSRHRWMPSGASTTRGYNDCPTPWIDCPDNSWSTGRNAAINSIYLRLLSLNPRLMNKNFNDAVSGSTMADLEAQAHSAVRRRVQLVTIAMGTNDACGGRTGAMTSVSAFEADFIKAMNTLTSGLPEARYSQSSRSPTSTTYGSSSTSTRTPSRRGPRRASAAPCSPTRPRAHRQTPTAEPLSANA